MAEKVNHPAHYNHGGIECIEAMVAASGKAAVVDFCKLNAFKYLWRAGTKAGSPEMEDLKKAQWYIGKAVELLDELEGKEE